MKLNLKFQSKHSPRAISPSAPASPPPNLSLTELFPTIGIILPSLGSHCQGQAHSSPGGRTNTGSRGVYEMDN